MDPTTSSKNNNDESLPAAEASTSTSHAAALPVPTLPPPAMKTDNSHSHKRNVSWGGVADLLQQPDLNGGEDEMMTNNKPGRIQAADLANRMPAESEADSYLIKSLENRDPTGVPREKSILSNINDAALSALTPAATAAAAATAAPNDTASVATANSRQTQNSNKPSFFKVAAAAVAKQQHRRNETVGDELQGLAAAMDAVNLQHLEFLDGEDPPAQINNANSGNINANKPVVGSADALQHNTNLLFQRHASQRKLADMEAAKNPAENAYLSTTPTEILATEGAGAEKRWKMLKHAVAATHMAGSPAAATPPGQISTSNGLQVPAGIDDSEEDESPLDNDDKKQHSFADAQPSTRKWRKPTTPEKFLRDLQYFVTPRQRGPFYFVKFVVFFIMLPCAGIAAVLFYFAGNLSTGVLDLEKSTDGALVNKDGDAVSDKTASASWWLLFIGVRQMVVVLIAKLFEVFLIDFLSIRSRFSVKIFGPWATLFILQTKGWPFLAFTWGLLSLGLSSGTTKFFQHWGYRQDYIDLFNESNPSGEIVDSDWNHRIVAIAIGLGIGVSIKRFWLGLTLGRATYNQFSDKLAKVMKKILLVSEVASLGRAFERYAYAHRDDRKSVSVTNYGVNRERLRGMLSSIPDEEPGSPGMFMDTEIDTEDAKRVIDPDDRHPMTGQLSMTQKGRIIQLLGQWEEPTLAEKKADAAPTVNEILQFRRALEYLHTPYPFSGSFGLADCRETTIVSSQEVYERMLLRSPDPNTLHFDVVALLGVQSEGQLNQDKLKSLIKLFRPDRDGSMPCVDFVKSIDEVYKELRLLRASVANSSKIDRAFESILNFLFYTIAFCLILSQLGYDPLALFLSISGVILAFAFMIGAASSKYFEGLLFILVRRPFSIGDGIALSGVNEQTASTGSPWWVVEDVDLFTTKVMFSFTGEKATLSNGSLASSRVINSTVSKEASLFVLVKFPIDVTYDKLQVFHAELKEFIKKRPREWIAFTRFRITRIEPDEGYIEYIICAQHRLPWSKWGDLAQSKADMLHYCLELSKKLDMWYKRPTVPIDLRVRDGNLSDALQRNQQYPSQPLMAPLSPGGTPTNRAELNALQTLFAPKND